MAQPLRVLVVDREEVAGQIVAAGGYLGGHQLAHVAAVVGHPAGQLDLLVRRRAAPGQRGAGAAPLLELRPVLLGHAHRARRSCKRAGGMPARRPGRTPMRHRPIQQLAGGRADRGGHPVDPLDGERAGRGPPQPRVGGLVQAHQGRLRLVSAGQEDLRGLGGQLDQRELRRRGREGPRVAEDALDVGVAGDHVVPDRWRVEDRRLVARQRGQNREGVGQVLGGKRVEVRADRQPGAALSGVMRPPFGKRVTANYHRGDA